LIIVVLVAPRFLPFDQQARARALARAEQRPPEQTRFVFVQPRNDVTAPKPPARAEPSDKNRVARAPERAPNPTSPLPFARGNTPERVEEPPVAAARGAGPTPEPAAGEPTAKAVAPPDAAPAPPTKPPEWQSVEKLPSPVPQVSRRGEGGSVPSSGGLLGDALRTLQRTMRSESFENSQGGAGQFGPEIQFDTKGVEFGPWIRRFVAQVKRNWIVPYAAWSAQAHVVITFNVHRDGSITDLTIVGPSPIDALNNSAFGALSASNPTQPLPPEYPSDKAFFTVSFFYNESPR
jgi:TonB family protein